VLVHRNRCSLHNLRGMLPFLWEFRGRALLVLACLILAKLANVGVLILLKRSWMPSRIRRPGCWCYRSPCWRPIGALKLSAA